MAEGVSVFEFLNLICGYAVRVLRRRRSEIKHWPIHALNERENIRMTVSER